MLEHAYHTKLTNKFVGLVAIPLNESEASVMDGLAENLLGKIFMSNNTLTKHNEYRVTRDVSPENAPEPSSVIEFVSSCSVTRSGMKNVPAGIDVIWLFVSTSVVSEVRPLNAVAEIDVSLFVEMSLHGM